jgi:hypothetical protein
MKLRKKLTAITAVLMLSSAAIPVQAASIGSESESWYSWFFSLFQINEANKADEDGASFSGVSKPEK